MIRFVPTLNDARAGGELRAGGIDLMDRIRRRVTLPDLDDLRDVPGLDTLAHGRIGAKVTIAQLAAHPEVQAGWPAVALAAGALATPQVRAVATLGGNLAQHVRCAYYRDPDSACMYRGDRICPAVDGVSETLAIEGSHCIAVHASTMACALLLYDTGVELDSGAVRTLGEVLGHGPQGVTGRIAYVVLPAAEAGERAAYRRAIHRARAEWPLVELAVRRVGDRWSVAAGGVGPLPVRLPTVEAALAAGEADAHHHAADGWKPRPGLEYKVKLLVELTGILVEELR